MKKVVTVLTVVLMVLVVSGVAQAAAVTWDDSWAWSEIAVSPDDYGFSSGGTNGTFGTGNYAVAGAGFSYTNSADGFSMSDGVSVNGWLGAGRAFTISGLGVGEGLPVSAMTNVSGVPSQINFMVLDHWEEGQAYWGAAFFLDNSLAFAAGPGPLTLSGLLGNGTYGVGLQVGEAVYEPFSTYNAPGTFASFSIPEPATMSILALGGLLLRKRS